MTTIFLSFLGISVSVGFIVSILILLSPLLNRRYAVKWKYGIWIFLALRLIIPFRGIDLLSALDLLSRPTQPATQSEDIPAAPFFTDTAPQRVLVEIPQRMAEPILPSAASGQNGFPLTILDLAAILWFTGCLLFLSVHLISYFHYKRQIMQSGTPIEDEFFSYQLMTLKTELQLRRAVSVMASPKATGPMVIGFLHPVLVLPKESYRTEELIFILKHELIHFRRKDVYWKLLFVAANAVHWFNPIIWLMQREAAVDMELSCDERVIQGADYAARKAYTETLLSTLHRQCSRKTFFTTQFYGGKQIMKKRFQNILIKSKKKSGCLLLMCTACITVCFGTQIGCSVAEKLPEPSDLNLTHGYQELNSLCGYGIDEVNQLLNENLTFVEEKWDTTYSYISAEGHLYYFYKDTDALYRIDYMNLTIEEAFEIAKQSHDDIVSLYGEDDTLPSPPRAVGIHDLDSVQSLAENYKPKKAPEVKQFGEGWRVPFNERLEEKTKDFLNLEKATLSVNLRTPAFMKDLGLEENFSVSVMHYAIQKDLSSVPGASPANGSGQTD